jgi:multisubunit Na+/H+ antiporter MnhB subunit
VSVALAFAFMLAALVVALAAFTVTARETYAATVGFVAYGLLLALVWVGLTAVDVALAEAAIGGGLTGVLLLGAATRLQPTEPAAVAERPGRAVRGLAAALSATVATVLAVAVLSLPDPAPTLAPVAAEHLAATGVGNPVTAVLMAYRATDTLLEKVVLVLALAGVWSLAPDGLWGARPGLRYRTDPNGPLAFLARLLPPVGLVVGVFILWVSADEPGGAFQGATIIAAMWQLSIMAGLADEPALGRGWLRLLLTVGPLTFLAVGLGGLWLGDAFLAYPPAFAKPLILVIEFAMLATVAATLALLMAGPPQRRSDS